MLISMVAYASAPGRVAVLLTVNASRRDVSVFAAHMWEIYFFASDRIYSQFVVRKLHIKAVKNWRNNWSCADVLVSVGIDVFLWYQ